jgi:hypothetical protein
MTSGTGSRPVTEQERAKAIKRELVESRSRFSLTPGMRRALAERAAKARQIRTKKAS